MFMKSIICLLFLLVVAPSLGAKCKFVRELPDNFQTKEVDAPGCIKPDRLIGKPNYCYMTSRYTYQLICFKGKDSLSYDAKYFFECFSEEYGRGKWQKEKGVWRCS